MPEMTLAGLGEVLRAASELEGVAGLLAFDLQGQARGLAPASWLPPAVAARTCAALGQSISDLVAVAPLGGVRSLIFAYPGGQVVVELRSRGGIAVAMAGAGNPALLRLRLRPCLAALDELLERDGAPGVPPSPPSMRQAVPLVERLVAVAEQELGDRSARAREMLIAASGDPVRLADAVQQVVRFTKLFVDAARSGRLEARLRAELTRADD